MEVTNQLQAPAALLQGTSTQYSLQEKVCGPYIRLVRESNMRDRRLPCVLTAQCRHFYILYTFSQGMLAIILCRIFCLPVCYPKIEGLMYTEV